MTTPRKTATEISAAIIAQLETSLSTTIPLLPKSFCRVLAKVLGGVFVMLYQFAGWILLQQFVKYASNTPIKIGGIEINPLQAWGDLVGIYQKTGQRAEREITITVLTQGGTITSGERIANPVTQMIYVVVGDVDLDAATVSATIRATRAGVLGNVDVDTELQFVSAPSDVEKIVTVNADPGTDVAGVDPEATEVFRERIQERFAARPQGGSYADYKDWAEEVTGVRNAYPYAGWVDPDIPNSRAGHVFVYVQSDVDDDGIPDSNLLTTVAEHIEGDVGGLANRRNINAYINVLPISRVTVDVTIEGLTTDDTTAARAAIEDGLTDYFLNREPGGQAGYTLLLPSKDVISWLQIGGVAGQIAAAYDGTLLDVIVYVDTVEKKLYELQEGEKAKLGTITWT